MFIKHFLQLEKSRRFVAANIAQVVRAATTQRNQPGVFKLGYVYLIIGIIGIIFNPEGYRVKQIIVLHQLNITNGVNFLSPADNFICTVIVNVFDKIW